MGSEVTKEHPGRVIDEAVKDKIRRYPTVDLVLKLFPDARMKGHSAMCNPLRGERHPSLSFFRDSSGISRWKDFAEDTKGDNIEFYRLVHPEADFATAVDELSWLLLGKSAFVGGGTQPERRQTGYRSRGASPARTGQARREPVLKIESAVPLGSPGCSLLVDYCAVRGISPAVAERYLRAVTFRNGNRQGRFLFDDSGRVVMGRDGRPLKDDGTSFVLGLPNDIGGYSLRGPDMGGRKGFKGCDSSFLSTVLADGSFPVRGVAHFGTPGSEVEFTDFDAAAGVLRYNGSCGFSGLGLSAGEAARTFLSLRAGRRLEARETERLAAVFSAMDAVRSPVAAVAEGMFDFLSFVELYHPCESPLSPGVDFTVLNSTSNYMWAYPFLALHREVHVFLDNDMRSSRGQKTSAQLTGEIRRFSDACGLGCRVYDDSASFAPCKDLNDYLVSRTLRQADRPRRESRHRHP